MTTLGLLLLSLLLVLAIGYLLTRSSLGTQAASQQFIYAAPWIVAGAIAAIALSALGRYGLTVLFALYSLVVLLWLASWPARKKQSGKLLHQAKATAQSKLLLLLSLVQVGIAIAMTLSLLDRFTGGLVTTGGILSGLTGVAFWWTNALLFFLLGRSRFEVHEHGLTYLFNWQPWERIAAFGWDDDQPSTLILKAIPRTDLSRKYLTIAIPPEQVEAVDQLLEQYLFETDLAAEMDGEGEQRV